MRCSVNRAAYTVGWMAWRKNVCLHVRLTHLEERARSVIVDASIAMDTAMLIALNAMKVRRRACTHQQYRVTASKTSGTFMKLWLKSICNVIQNALLVKIKQILADFVHQIKLLELLATSVLLLVPMATEVISILRAHFTAQLIKIFFPLTISQTKHCLIN